MSENQELKNGKWVDAEPLKFKPRCVIEYIWIIKYKLKRIVKKGWCKMKEFIKKLIGRLEEKFKYNSEQAEIYRDGSDKDAYFREKKDLYMDRANTYGEVMRIVNRLAEEYKGKYVKRGTFEQFKWERDVAIEQLKELGYGLGEKVGWIPVSERLPNDRQSIIAKYADGKIWQENFSLYLYENPRTYQMVAWIPMPPEPYKKGEK